MGGFRPRPWHVTTQEPRRTLQCQVRYCAVLATGPPATLGLVTRGLAAVRPLWVLSPGSDSISAPEQCLAGDGTSRPQVSDSGLNTEPARTTR